MFDAILWVAAIKLAGGAAFVLLWPAFRKLPDRGYGVAPVAALVALCWCTWAVGNTGVPAGRTLALVSLAGLMYLGWREFRPRSRMFRAFFCSHWRGVLAVETAFICTFALWVLVASENPAIDHTEKPMDFAIMNSIATSARVPPPDVWLAGESVVYYYGGHYTAAFLSNVTGIIPEYSYNLTVPSVAALAAGAITALAYNLCLMAGLRRRSAALWGLATCVACLIMSNGMGVVEWWSARGWGWAWAWNWLGIKELPASASEGFFPGGFWWWWRGTRVIDTVGSNGQSLDYTITEFPMFSFLLGDLHAHVSALPLAVLALTLSLVLLAWGRAPDLLTMRRNPRLFVAAALTLGTMGFTNAWDFPLHLGVMTLAAAVACMPAGMPAAAITRAELVMAGRRTALFGGIMATAGFALYLPFWQNFDSQAGGILPVLGPSTRPVHFLLTIGLPALLSASAVAMMIRKTGLPSRKTLAAGAALAAAPLLVWLISATLLAGMADTTPDIAGQVVVSRLTLALPLLLASAAAAYALFTLTVRNENVALRFVALLAVVGFGLLAGAELFRIDDQFDNRMNTVFKVYYQSWLLLWVAGVVGCVAGVKLGLGPRLVSARRATRRMVMAGILVVAVMFGTYYPVGAIAERTGWTFTGMGVGDNSLSALQHVRQRDMDEYRAIQWIRAQPNRGNIVEAMGGSYSDYGIIAAATGRPTILNWPGHEMQWRGDDLVLHDREQAVSEIYRNESPTYIKRLLKQYDVEYVFLGPREHAQYREVGRQTMAILLNEAWFSEAFRSGDVVVYRFDQSGPDPEATPR